MLKKIYFALFGLTVNENSIVVQAKSLRILFEALKKEGFSEEQAMEIVTAKFGARRHI